MPGSEMFESMPAGDVQVNSSQESIVGNELNTVNLLKPISDTADTQGIENAAQNFVGLLNTNQPEAFKQFDQIIKNFRCDPKYANALLHAIQSDLASQGYKYIFVQDQPYQGSKVYIYGMDKQGIYQLQHTVVSMPEDSSCV